MSHSIHSFSSHFFILNFVFSLFSNRQLISIQPIPLYTTARKYPWFTSRSPVAIPVQKDDETATYSYRYAVFRAGVFHRWEDPSDGPSDDGNVKMDVENEGTIATHKVPLKLLTVGEEYTINDVLGVTFGHPNIDHIRVPHNSGYEEMTMLHSTHRIDSFQKVKSGTSLSTSIHRVSSIPDTKKKKVGFAPEPPSYQGTDGHGGGSSAGMKREPVHLDSTDGLIVASAFLPVHLHRSPEGEWSADWDYEALLSMQTHLRVTRIGVVKWRGWHGNFGQQTCNKKSPQEGGVPGDERHKVEECLRQFNCVPVWVEPLLFGEM